MKNAKTLACSVLTLCALIASASAQMVDWTFSGTINQASIQGSPPPWNSTFGIGTPIQLKFKINSAATPTFTLPSAGFTVYDLTSGSADVGGTHFDFNQSSLAIIDDPSTPGHSLALGGLYFPFGISFNVQLSSSLVTPFGPQIPVELPPLSHFNNTQNNHITVTTAGGQIDWTVTASVDVIGAGTGEASAVPEPSTYGVFGAVFVAGLVLLRRRKTGLKSSSNE